MTYIEILRFIRIEYAHTHTASDYTYSLFTQGSEPDSDGILRGVMEIGYIEENPLLFTCEDKTVVCAEVGDIFILPPHRHFEVAAKYPGTHRHVTTEALIECRLGKRRESELGIELPLIIRSSGSTDRITSAIRRIASRHTAMKSDNYFSRCADYMNLIGSIRTCLAECESNVSPATRLYCKSAEQYIVDNISRKITVGEIADKLGISKNYLVNIFSAYKGMPLREYVNRLKLRHISELMLRFDCGIREAGEYVGITNANYISRMFRSYYGVPLTEYLRQMKAEERNAAPEEN